MMTTTCINLNYPLYKRNPAPSTVITANVVNAIQHSTDSFTVDTETHSSAFRSISDLIQLTRLS